MARFIILSSSGKAMIGVFFNPLQNAAAKDETSVGWYSVNFPFFNPVCYEKNSLAAKLSQLKEEGHDNLRIRRVD